MAAIIRRRPGRDLTTLAPFYHPLSLIGEIEELAREAWDSWHPFVLRNSFIPYLDMYEEKDELVVKTELTGVKKEDLDISLESDRLTIRAEKKSEEAGEDAKKYTSERWFGQYSRSLSLPFHVDADKASATFENGLLEIRFPRAEETKTKRIEVKAQTPQGGEHKRPRKRKPPAS